LPRSTRPDNLPPLDRALLVSGPLDAASTRKAFQHLVRALGTLPEEDFSSATIRRSIATLCDELGLKPGDLSKPLVAALTGRPGTGDPARLASRLGKKAAIDRLRRAIVELSTVA